MNGSWIGLALALIALPGCKRTDNEQACRGDDPDIGLVACTALIKADESSHAPKRNLAIAYGLRGQAYSKKGLNDQAIADTSKAIELEPTLAEGYGNRGTEYSDKGLYDRAIADEDMAIGLKPDYAMSYYNRARDYYFQGHLDQAIADSSRAIELKPDYAEAYVMRGISYRDKGLFDQAIADQTKAIALQPRDSDAFLNRGDAYDAKGLHDQAIADDSVAIKLDPHDGVGYNSRAWNLHEENEDAKGLPDAERAVALASKPELAIFTRTRAAIYERLNQRDKAMADYRAVLKLHPHDEESRRGLKRLGVVQ